MSGPEENEVDKAHTVRMVNNCNYRDSGGVAREVSFVSFVPMVSRNHMLALVGHGGLERG